MKQEAVRSFGVNGQPAASVLLVGNPSLPLKGFDVAIKALSIVNRVVPISLTWICQTQPSAANVPDLIGSGLAIDLYINPSQVPFYPSPMTKQPCTIQPYPPSTPALCAPPPHPKGGISSSSPLRNPFCSSELNYQFRLR